MAQIDRVRRRREPGFWITYNEIWDIDGLNPGAFTVYSYLLRLASQHNAVFPSHETIAKYCWMTDRSVRNHLKLLNELGLIEVESGAEKGQSNTYWVNDPDLGRK